MIAKKNLYFFQTVGEKEKYTRIRIGEEIKIGVNISEEAYLKLFGDLPDDYEKTSKPKRRGRKKKTLCMQ